MGRIWSIIHTKTWSKDFKTHCFLMFTTLLYGGIGALLWLVVTGLIPTGQQYLHGVSWLICFAGYPAVVIGLFGGMVYLYRHEI